MTDTTSQPTSTSGVSVSLHTHNAVSSSRPGSIDPSAAVWGAAVSRGPVSSTLPTPMQQPPFPPQLASRNQDLAKSSFPFAGTHPVNPGIQQPPLSSSSSPTSRAFSHMSASQTHPVLSSTSARPMSPLIPGLTQSQSSKPSTSSGSRLVTPTGPRASFVAAPHINGNSFQAYGPSMPPFPPQSTPTSTSGISHRLTSTSGVARDQNHFTSPSSTPGFSGPSSSNVTSGSVSGPMPGTSSASTVPRFIAATSLSQQSSSANVVPPKNSQAQTIPTAPSGLSQTTSNSYPTSTVATPSQANLVKRMGTSLDTKHATPIVAPNTAVHHPAQRPPINTPTAPRAGPSATQVAGLSSYAHGPTTSASGLPAHPLPQKPKAMAPMPRYRKSRHVYH